MRKDMSKVIVERPRVNTRESRFGKPAKTRHKDYRNLPKKESMKARHGGGTKELNENLAPLRRFFRSRLGRHWDKIFSEVCANIKLTSAIQKHVRDHVPDLVCVQTFIEDGEVFVQSKRGWRREVNPGELYVCPKTGILKEMSGKKAKYKFTNEDKLKNFLSELCKDKTGLLLDNGKVYKLYCEKKSDKLTIKHEATAVHAKLDFQAARWNLYADTLERTFKFVEPYVPMSHPYFATYKKLIAEEVAKYKEKPAPFKAGDNVEVSKDGWKTFVPGIVNFVKQVGKGYAISITVGSKNLRVTDVLEPLSRQIRGVTAK